MWRGLIAIFLGFFVGFLCVYGVQMLSLMLYPPPPELDFSNEDAFATYVDGLPIGAFLLLLTAHALGSLAAALTCCLIMGRTWYFGSLMLGFFFLTAGIGNLLRIPHPVWFAVADLLVYIPAAVVGTFMAGLLVRRPAPRKVGSGE